MASYIKGHFKVPHRFFQSKFSYIRYQLQINMATKKSHVKSRVTINQKAFFKNKSQTFVFVTNIFRSFILNILGSKQPYLGNFLLKGWVYVGQNTVYLANWIVYLTKHNGLIYFFYNTSFFFFFTSCMICLQI